MPEIEAVPFEPGRLVMIGKDGPVIPIDELDLETEDITDIYSYTVSSFLNTDASWVPPQPSSDANVWRYLNFTQLLSIFERDKIWFTDVSRFEDPYEGTIPSTNFKDELQQIVDEFDISEEDAAVILSAVRGPWSLRNRRAAYVNCWNVNEHQSAALWEQYVDSPQSIAIRTTVESLHRALDNQSRDMTFGEVEYINYEEDLIPRGDVPPVYHKRESFEHENEFRISYFPDDDEEREELSDGFYVEVDTDVLFDEIVISPVAPDWFSELVELVLERYGVECELVESELFTRPSNFLSQN